MTNQVDIPMLVDYTVAAGGPIPATPGVDYNSLIFGTLTFAAGGHLDAGHRADLRRLHR